MRPLSLPKFGVATNDGSVPRPKQSEPEGYIWKVSQTTCVWCFPVSFFTWLGRNGFGDYCQICPRVLGGAEAALS